jgi:DNA-binding NtrC family response regulator
VGRETEFKIKRCGEMGIEPILVVDDEPDMRIALTHALSQNGFPVETATDGLEAIKKFRQNKFSMVITDVKMPEMSGMEVLENVKKISPQVPVIMITAYGTIGNAVEAMQEGASDYIIKPFSSETLDTAVKKVHMQANHQAGSKAAVLSSGSNRKDGKIIITENPTLLKMMDLARKIAPSDSTVLISGESGTGKELLASFIHQNSERSHGPYVAINCAALPEHLTESELFGHEKGAFTGAVNRKTGKFELANRGTILLDEITEMSLPLQAKLLRVLQEREIDRVGGKSPIAIDVRVIAICNVDLNAAISEGRFREDLYYRINVIPIKIPPLRERKEDISLLANHFLEKYSDKNKIQSKGISDETIALLKKYDWKGNVRELENAIERAILLSMGETVMPKHLFPEETQLSRDGTIPIRVGSSVKEMERELIFKTLEEVHNNKTLAAKMLGISIRTLRNKLKEYREA